MKITFKSDEHKARYIGALTHFRLVYEGKPDVEYAAALYILTAHINTWQKAEAHISRDGIDFKGMIKKKDLSSGAYALVQLAANLFYGSFETRETKIRANMVDIVNLNEEGFQMAMEAIKIRRYGLSMDDLKDKQEVVSKQPEDNGFLDFLVDSE